MTETICPCCGAKCISNPKYRDDYAALPPPDLTKLGEAYGKLNEIADNPNIVGLDRFSKINQQIAIVLRAVKELLEEDK